MESASVKKKLRNSHICRALQVSRGEYLFLTVFAVRALVCVSWRDPCPPTAPPLPAERLEEL